MTKADEIREKDDMFMAVQIAGCIVSYLVQSKFLKGKEADHKDLISDISDDIFEWLQMEVEHD